MPKKYLNDFKDRALKRAKESGVKQTALELYIPEGTLRKWLYLDKNKERYNLQDQDIPKITFYSSGKEYCRKVLALDVDYSDDQRCQIFTHGKSNYNIWFLDSHNRLCLVNNCEKRDGNLYLNLSLNVFETGKKSKMSLDMFLYLIEQKQIRITNKNFCKFYLKSFSESNYFKTGR